MGNCLSRPQEKSRRLDYHPEPRNHRRRRYDLRRPTRYEEPTNFEEENPQCIPKHFKCCCNFDNAYQPMEFRKISRRFNHRSSNRFDEISEEELPPYIPNHFKCCCQEMYRRREYICPCVNKASNYKRCNEKDCSNSDCSCSNNCKNKTAQQKDGDKRKIQARLYLKSPSDSSTDSNE